MAKKKIRKAESERDLKCPGCGRRCLILETYGADDWQAFHEWRQGVVVSQSTGKSIEATVLWDGCTPGGPIGHKHKATFSEDEPF